MERGKIIKIAILVYFIVMLLVAFLPLMDVFIKNPSPISHYQVLDINLLDSSSKALSKRNDIFNLNINSIDLNSFTFGNNNPFQ